MINPLSYRPNSAQEDWADNWLSNALAWASGALRLDGACANPKSPLVAFVLYLWADCACCLAMRFAAIGILVGLTIGLAL